MGLAQWARLSTMHDDLNSNSQHSQKKPGVATNNPDAVGIRYREVTRAASLSSSSVRDPNWREWGRDGRGGHGVLISCFCMCIQTHAHAPPTHKKNSEGAEILSYSQASKWACHTLLDADKGHKFTVQGQRVLEPELLKSQSKNSSSSVLFLSQFQSSKSHRVEGMRTGWHLHVVYCMTGDKTCIFVVGWKIVPFSRKRYHLSKMDGCTFILEMTPKPRLLLPHLVWYV